MMSSSQRDGHRPPATPVRTDAPVDHKRRLLRCLVVFLLDLLCSFPAHAQTFTTPDRVDFEDFLAFVQAFGSHASAPNYNRVMDLNDDGQIDFPDFLGFARSYGSAFIQTDPPISTGTDTAYRALSNETRITLTFSQEIRLAADFRPTLSIPILAVETDVRAIDRRVATGFALDADRKTLRVVVPGIISDGSTLLLAESGLDSANPPSEISAAYGTSWGLWLYNAYQPLTTDAVLTTPFSPAQAALGQRPFAPTNTHLYTPGVFSDAPPMVPASGDTLSESAARAVLEAFLGKRPGTAGALQQALSAFDDDALLAKMASPTLRAGLISLSGTVASSAIDALVRGPFGPIRFGPVTSGDYADVRSDRSVVVDERYAAEAFPLFGAVFARIALQLDGATGRNEEITGSAFLALVAMEQALIDSSMARSGSELSRRLNTQMLARLNSGSANFPNIGIYQSPGGQAFPNGRFFGSYASVFDPLEDTATPAGILLAAYLKNLAPPGTELPSTNAFTADVLSFLDRHQNVLSPEELIHIAHILNLSPAK
jgi:hypothetical protein